MTEIRKPIRKRQEADMHFNPDMPCEKPPASSKTRVTLLRRIRDGSDPVAWEEFFARYWRLVFYFARRRGCSEHTAEEVVQDVMTTVFNKREVFRYDPAQGRFRDWLAAVVRNQVAMQRRAPAQRIRARGGEIKGDNITSPAETCLVDTDMPPDELWEAAFEETLLAALLDVVRRQVEPPTFQAFELTALGKLSAAEVAAVTGLSRNAVYQARRAVIKRLVELGSAYRDDGRLDQQVKRALQLQPRAAVQRSIAGRVSDSMRSVGSRG